MPARCPAIPSLIHGGGVEWENTEGPHGMVEDAATADETATARRGKAVQVCAQCGHRAAALKRPKDGSKLCKDCFFFLFEEEVHHAITEHSLFRPGERVAVAASGGKGT